ncbi:MAG: hypothetical protein EOP49_49090 [Sphingobacteriales bacterium]|nr:MAG: hypothetical protein EOP49_49090 [Sphingobacteriales bacterium]
MQIKNIEGLSVAQIRDYVKMGSRFVVFPYTVSIVLATFKRSSSIYFIHPEEKSIKYSYKHILANGVAGWWGLPWGPIYTVQSLYHQLSGGKDITDEVMSHLIQNDPDADTSTYNINGIMTSNNQNDDTPTYNIPN